MKSDDDADEVSGYFFRHFYYSCGREKSKETVVVPHILSISTTVNSALPYLVVTLL